MIVECPYTLQWDASCPPSILSLPMGGSGPLSNTWFPGPTQVLNPNSILIGSVVFAELTSVTDWQTDRLIDYATRAMWPNNNTNKTINNAFSINRTQVPYNHRTTKKMQPGCVVFSWLYYWLACNDCCRCTRRRRIPGVCSSLSVRKQSQHHSWHSLPSPAPFRPAF